MKASIPANRNMQLADFMRIEVEDQQGQLRFFRRLLNYDDWRIAGRPQSTQFLDYQVGNSDIEAERDHLRVGDHFVRVLTMNEAITETRPLVLNSMLNIRANFYVVTEWTPLPADNAPQGGEHRLHLPAESLCRAFRPARQQLDYAADTNRSGSH